MSADRFLPPVKSHGANLAGEIVGVGNPELPVLRTGLHSGRAGSPSLELENRVARGRNAGAAGLADEPDPPVHFLQLKLGELVVTRPLI